MVELDNQLKEKFEFVLANVDKLDFGDKDIIPLINDSERQDYEWDASFIGITKDGKIGYVFDSGCSCNDPEWDSTVGEEPDSLTYNTIKGLELEVKNIGSWYDSFSIDELDASLDKLAEKIK